MPAALGGAIHQGNADSLNCRVLIEGANAPTTPAADEILADKGVHVIPDVLANAGGVVVSYFEWVQNLQHFSWDEDEVNAKLEKIMRRGYQRGRASGPRRTACRCGWRLRARHRARASRRPGPAATYRPDGRRGSRAARRPVRAARSKRTLPARPCAGGVPSPRNGRSAGGPNHLPSLDQAACENIGS